MSGNKRIVELIGDINSALTKVEKIESFYNSFQLEKNSMPENRPYDLIILADIFCDFYTCIETGFLRISKFFENNLDSGRWHQHLIEKMTIDIPGVRKRLLEDTEYNILLEFLKFRHFKRYYFEYEYDRERMDYLQKRFGAAVLSARNAFKRYLDFCRELAH